MICEPVWEAIIKGRFNFFKQLVHTGNTAFCLFLFFSGFVSVGSIHECLIQ